MSKQRTFWDFEEHLGAVLVKGDPLEKPATVDFERFRPILEKVARPVLDAVLEFRMLALQSFSGLSLDATETMVRDRMTWLHI